MYGVVLVVLILVGFITSKLSRSDRIFMGGSSIGKKDKYHKNAALLGSENSLKPIKQIVYLDPSDPRV